MECKNLRAIVAELQNASKYVEEEQVTALADEILKAEQIFIGGAGRSGFVGRAFANRLMHVGFHVYFVGEPTTTCIKKNDLLILLSGSGNTESLVNMAEKAKSLKAKIAAITIFPKHKIGTLANILIQLQGTSLKSEDSSTMKSIQMDGSIFEQLAWLVCDTLVLKLMEKTKQTSADLFARHANLE